MGGFLLFEARNDSLYFMSEGFHMTPNKRAGEIRIWSEKIGEFRADYNLDPKELEAIRVSLAREQESVIKAAHESQLGLRSMVFRDFRSVSEKHVKAHGKTMKEVQTKLSNIDNDGDGEIDHNPLDQEEIVSIQNPLVRGLRMQEYIWTKIFEHKQKCPEIISSVVFALETKDRLRSRPVFTFVSVPHAQGK